MGPRLGSAGLRSSLHGWRLEAGARGEESDGGWVWKGPVPPALSSSPEDFWHFLSHPHGEPPLSIAKDCLRLQAPVCEGWGGERR